MFEARRVIEESVASLAAQLATGEQVAALEEEDSWARRAVQFSVKRLVVLTTSVNH
jgi:DNA-binding FadR family transcriptional regulator